MAHISGTDRSQLLLLPEVVYRTLSGVDETEPAPAVAQSPAVPVGQSVFSDFIVCLEDGKKLKMLKRHLQTSYGLTPDDYRAKWGLPRDYPMVASNYDRPRSAMANIYALKNKSTTRVTSASKN